ncbi:MAG: hypothetical protein ACQEXJ_22980 [Myxococcota bacterium]
MAPATYDVFVVPPGGWDVQPASVTVGVAPAQGATGVDFALEADR